LRDQTYAQGETADLIDAGDNIVIDEIVGLNFLRFRLIKGPVARRRDPKIFPRRRAARRKDRGSLGLTLSWAPSLAVRPYRPS
jgi:hypothetical protein